MLIECQEMRWNRTKSTESYISESTQETVTTATSILQMIKLKDKKRIFENEEPIFKFIVNHFFLIKIQQYFFIDTR